MFCWYVVVGVVINDMLGIMNDVVIMLFNVLFVFVVVFF